MASHCNSLLYFFFFFFIFTGFASCDSKISFDALDRHGRPGRNLFQKSYKVCKVKFARLDYHILTRRCRGPLYPPKQCCSAFLKFACPFADQVNDMTTDCAETMFTYIDLHGKYPMGLFYDICKDQGDAEGLACES
ncbi:GPI-anchored protein LORELEI [Euphorbia peplus]|nr:GPI-anchored protein LORELEI [Euphorbia peplus]